MLISRLARNTDIIDSVHLKFNTHWLSSRRLCPMTEEERELAPSLESGRQERTKHVFW